TAKCSCWRIAIAPRPVVGSVPVPRREIFGCPRLRGAPPLRKPCDAGHQPGCSRENDDLRGAVMRPPVPPFTEETARQKVQAAEDAWNTRDPERVASAYSEDS